MNFWKLILFEVHDTILSVLVWDTNPDKTWTFVVREADEKTLLSQIVFTLHALPDYMRIVRAQFSWAPVWASIPDRICFVWGGDLSAPPREYVIIMTFHNNSPSRKCHKQACERFVLEIYQWSHVPVEYRIKFIPELFTKKTACAVKNEIPFRS